MRKTYRFKDIAWIDLTLIPIYYISISIFGNMLHSIFELIQILAYKSLVLTSAHMLLGTIMSFLLVVGIYYLIYRGKAFERLKNGLSYLKKHRKFILIVSIIVIAVQMLTNMLMSVLPGQYKVSETTNEAQINGLFGEPSLLPLVFILIVIIAPITEEFIFRHILIGELGKKFSFPLMAVISVLGFALIHVTNAKSPFEIIPYLILGIAFVTTYLLSGRKLVASIAVHMVNNGVSFMLSVLTM